ncbi:MAG: hypothetical protein QXV32_06635 [Conexivisphaerales archaeon]
MQRQNKQLVIYSFLAIFVIAASAPGLFYVNTAFAQGTLAIDNSGNAKCTATLTVSGTLSCNFTTTSSSDVIIVFVSSTTGTAGTPTASGISLSSPFSSRNSLTTSTENAYEFYAITSSSGTVTISDSVSGISPVSVMIAFAVSGADTSSPFDPSLSTAPTPTTGSSTNPTITFSTSGTDDMLLGLVGSPISTTFSAGTGSTMIASNSLTTQTAAAEYEDTTKSGSQTQQFTTTLSVSWVMFGDALVSPTGVPEFPVGLLPFLIIIPAIYFVMRRLGKVPRPGRMSI